MNAMQDLLSHLSAEGFDLSYIEADGKYHRFPVNKSDKKNSGFYKAYNNNTRDGQNFFVIIYGDWHNGEIKTYNTLKGKVTKEDRQYIKKTIDEAVRAAEKEREKNHEEVASSLLSRWNALSDQGKSEYLIRKKINECPDLGIKYGPFEGEIYVPARDKNNKFWSWQRISADGGKRFASGGRISCCYHVIGTLSQRGNIYIAEGFATAVSISLGTGCGSICAFDSGNLGAVANEIRRAYPDATCIICGDDDIEGRSSDGTPFNTGRVAAEKAGALSKAIFPVFKSVEKGQFLDKPEKIPTDFNDLHCLEGIDEVKRQILGIEQPEKLRHYALGFKDSSYFFTSTHNQQVVKIISFTETDFLNLMPLKYWEFLYPAKNKVDWTSARSALMQECRDRGIFESKKIRGAGVWNDDGRVIVNMGDHLIVDGHRTNLGTVKSRYFYTLGIKLPELHNNPLTALECEPIIKACKSFKWVSEDFGWLLAGAMVTTRVCGALPIRPHVWITGERGSGKSTLFNRLIYPLIGEPLLFLAGNSTEAGVRQEVSANAIPVLFDEFENNGKKSAETIQSVLDLMRVAWSETNAMVVKGSSGGVAQSFQVRFSAIVASIRQISLNDADQSRFATIELASHENNLKHWNDLDALLNSIDVEYGNRLFARTIKLLPVLLENFKIMKRALNKKCPGQRFADQYGMLLAGYALLIQDVPLIEMDADCLAAIVPLEEARNASSETDQEQCLDHLLTKKITLQEYDIDARRTERFDYSVSEAILKAQTNPMVAEALENYGIRVDTDTFSIRVRHSELESLVYNNTGWSKSWAKSLKRLPGAKIQSVRISKIVCKCVVLPLNILNS